MKLTVVNESIVVDETRERTDLKTLIETFLEKHDFFHLYFHSSNYDRLVYDIFVTNLKIVHSKKTEFEIGMSSYYLKKFLLLDDKTSIEAANQSADLIIKSTR